jgi:hypothetical protein
MSAPMIPLFPNLPQDTMVMKDGRMHPAWFQFFNDLTRALQTNFSLSGFLIPKQSTTMISGLTDAQDTGILVYDSTLNELKVNLNGTIKTITTS